MYLKTKLRTAGSRFQVFNVFLNTLSTVKNSRFVLNHIHISVPLKQRACVSFLEVLVSSDFNNCFILDIISSIFQVKKLFHGQWT